jgi:hypothetical protein
MKTLIKTGLAALVIAVSFTACDPASKSPANSQKIDTGKTTTAIDTTKIAKPDSAIIAVDDSTKK